jgi:glycosyltransferase involved in cell wall biosynthesis
LRDEADRSMKISVACCIYNGAIYLDEQLDSIAAQTVVPHEIVVVDDGSTDDSGAIVERFAARVAGTIAVRSVRNDANLGVTKNFEKALSLTTGDLIFLCDQDDRWHPEKVATMRDQFIARPELSLLFTEARRIDAKGEPMSGSLFDALELSDWERRTVHAGSAYRALLRRSLATGATVALRRSVFEFARPFELPWLHDEWLAINAAVSGRVDFLELPLIDYRQHPKNQVGMRTLTTKEKFRTLGAGREQRYQRMARAAEKLAERLETLGSTLPPDRLQSARNKAVHARFRAALPAARLRRILPLAGEALRGGYARYSSGWRAFVRDLFEPP